MNLFTSGVPNKVLITDANGVQRETVIVPINVMYDQNIGGFLMKAVDRATGNIVELDFTKFEPSTKW